MTWGKTDIGNCTLWKDIYIRISEILISQKSLFIAVGKEKLIELCWMMKSSLLRARAVFFFLSKRIDWNLIYRNFFIENMWKTDHWQVPSEKIHWNLITDKYFLRECIKTWLLANLFGENVLKLQHWQEFLEKMLWKLTIDSLFGENKFKLDHWQVLLEKNV